MARKKSEFWPFWPMVFQHWPLLLWPGTSDGFRPYPLALWHVTAELIEIVQYNRFGTLLKEGEQSEPSFTTGKVLYPNFWFWYFEAVRFASRIFLHQSTTSYFFKNFGTLKQSDLLCKSSCIEVLHISLQLWYFGAVRFTSQIFLHQSTASYSIVLSQVHLFFDIQHNKAKCI